MKKFLTPGFFRFLLAFSVIILISFLFLTVFGVAAKSA